MPLRLPIVSKFDSTGILQAQTGLDRLGGLATNAGALVAGAFAAAAVSVGIFTVSSLKAADESWKVSKALEQAAKNSGVFGSTEADIKKATDALKEHAQQLGELTGIDDEVLLSIEKTWMAVPELVGLGTEGIKNLAQVTADVAAGTSKDVETIGLAFIKIAGDEETAMNKLVRSGVVFSDQQKETYKALLDNNDLVGAQTYLIGQLGDKYEGMAEAAASPLARINQMWTNFQETVGTALMPTLELLAPLIGSALAAMVADPEFEQLMADLGQSFVEMLPSVKELMPQLLNLAEVAIPALIAVLPGITDFIGLLNDAFNGSSTELQDFKKYLEIIFIPLQILITILGIAIEVVKEIWKRLADNDILTKISNPIESAKGAFEGLARSISQVIDWWNQLWGLQSSKPVGRVNFKTIDGNGGVKLATGGIVLPRPGGTMATIGEGGQAEAVIPLDRLGKMMGNGGGGAVYNINISTLKADASIGEIIVNSIKKYERTSGAVFAGA